MSSDGPRHLVVLPAFNEECALPDTIARLDALPAEYELLVVDDGSTDGTSEVARQLAAARQRPIHVVRLDMNCGIGAAVQTGYRFAAMATAENAARLYRYVIQFDADGQHDAAAIPALVAACERENLDVCIGSRFLEPSSICNPPSSAAEPDPQPSTINPQRTSGFQSTRLRRIGIRFFARLISLLSGVKVTDPTSGLRCVGPRAWRRFAESYPDDYPEPEVLFWCARNHLRLGEIPVRMSPRASGVSSIRYLGTVYYMLKVTLAILIDRLRRREATDN